MSKNQGDSMASVGNELKGGREKFVTLGEIGAVAGLG
jgi:hypothetical protein